MLETNKFPGPRLAPGFVLWPAKNRLSVNIFFGGFGDCCQGYQGSCGRAKSRPVRDAADHKVVTCAIPSANPCCKAKA